MRYVAELNMYVQQNQKNAQEYTLKSRKRVWKSLHPSQDMEIRFDTR